MNIFSLSCIIVRSDLKLCLFFLKSFWRDKLDTLVNVPLRCVMLLPVLSAILIYV